MTTLFEEKSRGALCGTTVSSTDTHSEFYSVQIELVYLSFGKGT